MIAWFENLQIAAKSALATMLAIVGLIGVAAGSILVFERLTQDFRSLNETAFVRVTQATQLDRAVLQVNAELYAISSLAANSNEAELVSKRIVAVLQDIDEVGHRANTISGPADGAGDRHDA
jgi:hypothetical protein